MKRNNVVAASAMVALLLGLTACASAGPEAQTGAAAKSSAGFGDCPISGEANSVHLTTATKGTLTAATDLPSKGWWDGADPDHITGGFEYCLAANIAHRAGLKTVTIQNNSWDQLISGVRTDYDLGMATITITEDRKKAFDFSSVYFTSNLGVAVRKGSDVTPANLKTKRIGVLQGTIGAQFVTETLKAQNQPQVFQGDTDMFTALRANQIDAVVTDTTLCLTLGSPTASNGELNVIGQYAMDQGYGMIMPKGTPNAEAVDAAISDMKKKGTIDALSKQFLQPLYGIDPQSIPIWKP